MVSQFCTVDYISRYNTQLSACRGYALPMRTNWVQKEEEKKKEKMRREGERELHNNNTPQLRTRLLSQFCTVDYISTYNTQLSACRGYAPPVRTLKLDPEEEGKKEEEEKKKEEKKASNRREGVT